MSEVRFDDIMMFMFNISVEKSADADVYTVKVVSDSSVESFEVMSGYVELSNNECVFDLSKENALLLREFLAGKDFNIDLHAKAFLKFYADETFSDKTRHSVSLAEMRDKKITYKFGRIKTEWDLLHYVPYRYIDRSAPQNIDSLKVGDWAVVVGRIVNDVRYDFKKNFLKIVIQDISGKRISSTFFRQRWLANKFKTGDEVVLYGNYSEYVNKAGSKFPQIVNSQIDLVGTTKGDMPVIPLYPQKDGDKSWRIQSAVKKMLNNIVWIEDPVPEVLLKKYGFVSRNQAYRWLHFPSNMEEMKAARERLAFDDFVRLQVLFHNKRNSVKRLTSQPKPDTIYAEKFLQSLPYSLTEGQKQATEEIFTDLESKEPMLRLLQGDVGSGKTTVAFAAALKTVGSGQQTVIVAPTDILANQLYNNFSQMVETAGLTVNYSILNGNIAGQKKNQVLSDIADGTTQVLFSTHAVFYETKGFHRLGLVVIDEQHKFGVEQRNKLLQPDSDGFVPDMLTMSATPIPRTTAQVVYGDMDISVINVLPEGRKPIETFWVEDKHEAYKKVLEQVEAGFQAYIVAALVEESETLEDVEDAETVVVEASEFFSPYSVGLVHGRMKKTEKDKTMEEFKNGSINILVSTSVVEVGVNVPNATVMVVLNSNRFGIASLHQIRGRVGRSTDQSYCYLVGEATTLEAEERLTALTVSNDGFFLAEKDLEIRGEGKILGHEQAGNNELFVANLRDFKHILDVAKKVVKGAAHSELLQKEIELVFPEQQNVSG